MSEIWAFNDDRDQASSRVRGQNNAFLFLVTRILGFGSLILATILALRRKSKMALRFITYFWLVITYARAQEYGDAELMYEWKTLEFDWPSDAHKEEAIGNKTYIPERNMVAGIKVYSGDVYLTIPRWFWTSGHPVTLAKVVTDRGATKLRPYPNWAAQKQGDCNALQYVQGMEIDPNSGLMYVIDTGRVGEKLNLCPAKIVVYDLKTDREVQKYELSADVASHSSNFMNDIVLDYIGGKVRFAYITDANDARLIVFDFQTRTAVTVEHPSMGIEGNGAENIQINGHTYQFQVALDGIAMSPEFKYVYYCSLAGLKLYQVPTSSLRRGHSDGVRVVGSKVSQSGGIGYGSKHLFYGALGLNAVFFWDSGKDMLDQKKEINEVTLKSEKQLVRNDSTMQWPDTFGFDNKGWIWFVSNRLQVFRKDMGILNDTDAYMRVWRVFVDENGYLMYANRRTEFSTFGGNSGSSIYSCSYGAGTLLFFILSYLHALFWCLSV